MVATSNYSLVYETINHSIYCDLFVVDNIVDGWVNVGVVFCIFKASVEFVLRCALASLHVATCESVDANCWGVS